MKSYFRLITLALMATLLSAGAVAAATGNKQKVSCLWPPGDDALPPGQIGTTSPVPSSGVPLTMLSLACAAP